MSHHIGAAKGAIAETVLFPGDPLRARFIAEHFLTGAELYSDVRGMLGYTGTFKGKAFSVQGSGMGIPSLAIYAHELIYDYAVKTLVRVGSCGSYQEHIKVRDIILAQGASSDSQMNKLTFRGMDFAPLSDFGLLKGAYDCAQRLNIPVRVGNVLASDRFYQEEETVGLWAKHGILAVEMETSGLYTIAARAGIKALSILTVSDNLITKEFLSAQERETSFRDMVTLALETLLETA